MTTQELSPEDQEQARLQAEQEEEAAARRIFDQIEREFEENHAVMDRMEDDYDLYTLKRWSPDIEDSISPEDAYTTNAPRVMAEKIISFINSTEVVIRVPNDDATKEQESVNDALEQLSIGMLANSDRRLRRKHEPTIKEQLAWFTVVRGRYAAVRALLRKRENGETYEDILPLDPMHLVVGMGPEEPEWAAYRTYMTRREIRLQYPGFEFTTRDLQGVDETQSEAAYEYYLKSENPLHNPQSQNPFERHPFIYFSGMIIDQRWARPMHPVFTLNFPIIAIPVTAHPMVAGTTGNNDMCQHVGESVFAENRQLYEKHNRLISYGIDMAAKASNPRQKIFSIDGEAALEDGSTEKGAEVPLSTANQEDIQPFLEPDATNAYGAALNIINQESVAGGLPPESFGLLDKPLSSVALRQLGNNLEHRVQPRMEAVRRCIEGCLEVMLGQYETGAFSPITVSGRRFDNHRFSNKQISPFDVHGHDSVEVEMALALPEDETVRWSIAQMAMTPTPSGEPLASLEWTREHILKMQSHKTLADQNKTMLAYQNTPIAALLDSLRAAQEDGDNALVAALYDQMRLAVLQHQLQGSMAMFQLQQLAQGIPPMTMVNSQTADDLSAPPRMGGAGNNQRFNPANGAVPAVSFSGMGNNPSPQAGFNTTAPRQRDTGLVNSNIMPVSGQQGR